MHNFVVSLSRSMFDVCDCIFVVANEHSSYDRIGLNQGAKCITAALNQRTNPILHCSAIMQQMRSITVGQAIRIYIYSPHCQIKTKIPKSPLSTRLSSLKFQEIKGLIGHTFMVYTKNQNQRNLYPFVLLEISVLNESTLGHLHYLLTDVPLQPNSLSDNIFNPRSAY